MKTEQEIRQELERRKFELNQTMAQLDSDPDPYLWGQIDALKFMLGPMPPEKAVAFACPKCGGGLLAVEPCSGFYKYEVDKYTGELIYDNDFEVEESNDKWFECSKCRTIMDGRWRDWYEKERPRDEEDSDG